MMTPRFTSIMSHQWRVFAVFFAVIAALTFHTTARAFSSADADLIYAAHNKAFYFTNEDGAFFRTSTDGDKESFWQAAEQMEMVLDVYERTTNAACMTTFSNLFTGFISEHGTNWLHNAYNDDIMWMVIACARAHQFTGNAAFFEAAKSNFDPCFARAWSTNLGGGLWWRIENRSKNACVNGPAAIAAFLLYQISGDTNYLAKSRAAYEWERQTLFNSKTGKIYDNITASGRISFRSFTYNEGTFIGAANFLGQTNDARLAVDYTRQYLCTNGMLPAYSQDGDAAGFNGIFARWCAKFVRERGLEKDYLGWLQANADAAWKCRRPSDRLAWSRWPAPTPPDEVLYSWACSTAVVMMQVVPPNQ